MSILDMSTLITLPCNGGGYRGGSEQHGYATYISTVLFATNPFGIFGVTSLSSFAFSSFFFLFGFDIFFYVLCHVGLTS